MKRIYVITTIYSLILIGLHFFSFLLPSKYIWGFHHFDYFPFSFRVIACTLAVFLCLPFMSRRVASWFAAGPSNLDKLRQRSPTGFYAVLSILCLFPLWWLRTGNFFLGDAIVWVAVMANPEKLSFFGYNSFLGMREPLDSWFHYKLYQYFPYSWGMDVYDVYAITSVASGALFILIILKLGAMLFQESHKRRLFVAIMLSIGTVQLFFGYVESYTMMVAGVALFLYLGLRCLLKGGSVVWPALVLSLSICLHFSAACLLPSLLALAFVRQGEHATKVRKRLILTATPFVAPFLIVITLMIALGDASLSDLQWPHASIVPLFKLNGPLERYTMFSLDHLSDIINEQILISPFGLLLCCIGCLWLRGWAKEHPRSVLFLGLAGASYLAFALVANPELGGKKDWDLFSASSVPLTLLGAYWVLDSERNHRLGTTMVTVAIVSLLHTVPWVLSNAKVDCREFLEREDRANILLRKGMTLQATAEMEAALRIIFVPELAERAGKIYLQTGQYDKAEKKFRQSIAREDHRLFAIYTPTESYFNLGRLYVLTGRYDEAAETLEKLLAILDKQNLGFSARSNAHFYLGKAYMKKGFRDKAVAELRRSLEIEEGNAEARELLEKLERSGPDGR